jgi:hypothetical protein
MIKIDCIKELIKTIIYTGYVEGERPINVFFVGNYGIGKSETLKLFDVNDNIAYFTDVTYMGIIKLLQDVKEVRHIVIPDFLKITMKKASTVANIISCLNAGIEEGIDKISMMGQSFDFKGKRFGLISATTKMSFSQHRKTWDSMGFLSRMIIVSFDYKQSTKEEIFEYIFNRGYLTQGKEKMQLPYKNIPVKLPRKLAAMLRDKDIDFRRQKQLQTLAMARAIINHPNETQNFEVTEREIQEVNNFKKLINLNYTKI